MNLEESYQYCLNITRSHYENFPVASIFIPKSYRRHIAAVYAFARIADDFSDEEKDLAKLMDWRKRLQRCTTEPTAHPVFQALSHTIRTFDLPVVWLDDLLTAFILDLQQNRFSTLRELYNYCRYSAIPVGRIVLWIFGYRDESIMRYSDKITTALQLTNFWQDISVDLKKDRIYIPTEVLKKFKIRESQLFKDDRNPAMENLVGYLVKVTDSLYRSGYKILEMVSGRLRWELKLTILGGRQILYKVLRNRQNILSQRPALTKPDWTKVIIQSSVK